MVFGLGKQANATEPPRTHAAYAEVFGPLQAGFYDA